MLRGALNNGWSRFVTAAAVAALGFAVASLAAGQTVPGQKTEFDTDWLLGELSQRIELTDDQYKELRRIFEEQSRRLEDRLQGAEQPSRSEMRTAVREVQRETDRQVEKVLDIEQYVAYLAYMAELRNRVNPDTL